MVLWMWYEALPLISWFKCPVIFPENGSSVNNGSYCRWGCESVCEREGMMERVRHNGRERSIHKSNKVMTFRVIKFCKHSPSGLTVISNLLSSSFPFFLFPFPIPSSHLTHSLTFSSCSSSIEHLSTPDIFVYAIFVFDFHFSFFFCPHCPLLSFVLLALSYFLAGLIVFFSH